MVEAFPFYDWAATIFIGFLVVSYWRSTWTLMDIWDCGQPPDAKLAFGTSFCFLVDATFDPEYADIRLQSANHSYIIGICCLFLGVFIIWMGWWVPQSEEQKVTPLLSIIRFFTVYVLGVSAVNIWRGIWYWADAFILPDNPTASYWTTSIAGSSLAFLLGAGNSLLAPPAIFIIDGPGFASPPIAVTLLSTYYSVALPADGKPPEISLLVKIADVVISFVVLPFGVVGFWRGSWLLLGKWINSFPKEMLFCH
jgi:hypothetical protein